MKDGIFTQRKDDCVFNESDRLELMTNLKILSSLIKISDRVNLVYKIGGVYLFFTREL